LLQQLLSQNVLCLCDFLSYFSLNILRITEINRRCYVGSCRFGARIRRSNRKCYSCCWTNSCSSVFYRIPRQIQGRTWMF